MPKQIAIVDDDPTQRRLIQSVLEREGFEVLLFDGGHVALDQLMKGPVPDAMILDLVMPEISGFEVLKQMRARGFHLPVIVLTATGGIDTVVKAMQAGAQDFFAKPAAPERILVSLQNVLQIGQLKSEVIRLTHKQNGKTSFSDLIGHSRAMRLVKDLGERAAKSNIPVLILGESGVGKEVIARAIHGTSDRSGKAFITVNCGALPLNLVESILFGHEKGAFTGAHEKHIGKFQEADGGTLFLDEIGELPLDMQVKLLRVLQEGEVDPVGSKRPVKLNVRILSATNRDLADQVSNGSFREDLFYRLNVFPIEAPPLRERGEDIPALVETFIRRFNAQEGRRVMGVTGETMAMLQVFDWPGNVRQLENTIYRAIILADGPYLTMADFPAISKALTLCEGKTSPSPYEGIEKVPLNVALALSPSSDTTRNESIQDILGHEALSNLPRRSFEAAQQNKASTSSEEKISVPILDPRGHLRKLDDIEHDLIQFALEVYSGHITEISRRLGIGRSTLYRKLRDHGLEPLVTDS